MEVAGATGKMQTHGDKRKESEGWKELSLVNTHPVVVTLELTGRIQHDSAKLLL